MRFEQQPKKFTRPKVLLLNIELELKAEKENAEIRLKDPSQYQSIVDAEWNIIYEKLQKCVKIGANLVFSRLAIGDLATQYFADRNIFSAGRVAGPDLEKVAKATGAKVQMTLNNLSAAVLGECDLFEEKGLGIRRYNILTGCSSSHGVTLILRGGSEQFIDEVERSLHDAIMIVRRTLQHPHVVLGAGAIDMEVSKYLHNESRKIDGKSQLFISAYAKALEVIPRQLSKNAGLDETEILNTLRHKHHSYADGDKNFGVDLEKDAVGDIANAAIYEPSSAKINALQNSTEAVCMILSIDETVRNPSRMRDDEQSKTRGIKNQ